MNALFNASKSYQIKKWRSGRKEGKGKAKIRKGGRRRKTNAIVRAYKLTKNIALLLLHRTYYGHALHTARVFIHRHTQSHNYLMNINVMFSIQYDVPIMCVCGGILLLTHAHRGPHKRMCIVHIVQCSYTQRLHVVYSFRFVYSNFRVSV